MRISQREMTLVAVTLSVLLVGVTFIVGKPVLARWGEIGDRVEQRSALLQKQLAQIEAREQVDAKYAQLSKLMPEFPAEQKMDIHWLSVMDKISFQPDVLCLVVHCGLQSCP
jgi:hypothetical protein